MAVEAGAVAAAAATAEARFCSFGRFWRKNARRAHCKWPLLGRRPLEIGCVAPATRAARHLGHCPLALRFCSTQKRLARAHDSWRPSVCASVIELNGFAKAPLCAKRVTVCQCARRMSGRRINSSEFSPQARARSQHSTDPNRNEGSRAADDRSCRLQQQQQLALRESQPRLSSLVG